MSESDWAPDACTLPTAERPLRVAEFAALDVRRVESISATHTRLHYSGDPEQVRDLAARETECCSFFRFTVTDSTLDVEVPDRYADVLAALVTRVS
jgi:hypothetical protein